MNNYFAKRILQAAGTIVALSFVCFSLLALMPGDPVDAMLSSNPGMTSEDAARLKAIFGLDQPITTRYYHWAKNTLQGDLGYSRQYRVPVWELMAPRLLNTFILSMTALTLSLLIAIPLGVMSALKPGSKLDYFLNLFSFGGISIPSFWLGIVLIIIFSVKFPLLPAGGTTSVDLPDSSFFTMLKDRLGYLILPVCSLSIMQIGRFSRFARSAMIDTMRNDFIRTAKAKGLSRTQVIWKHGFRNALLPLITVVSLSLSGVFSGAVLTETVFAYQGVGKLVYDSIMANDYNVAMFAVLISITMVLIMNTFADIAYSFADPRISFK